MYLFMFRFTRAGLVWLIALIFGHFESLLKAGKRCGVFKIPVRFSFLVIVGTWPLATQAQVNYTIYNGTAIVTASYNTASGNVVIASTYDGYPVTSMDDYAFYNCNRLTNILIPDSITNIPEYTFTACYNLTNVTIGKGVTTIGAHAFDTCSMLKNITIPGNVISIGDEAFNQCYELTNIAISDGLASLGSSIFLDCQDLTCVILPNSVTNMGTEVFSGCYSLTNVTLSDQLISIGADNFAGCSNLVNLTIPNSVNNMSGNAFSGCPELTSVTFLGNAPSLSNPSFFVPSPPPPPSIPTVHATIYYYYGTTGWGITYGNLPTVELFEPPQIGQTSAYMEPDNFNFTITGVNGQTVVVETSTNLMDWEPIWTNTLSGASTIFTDWQETNYSQRYYRAK
jgi:hypothetical protein